MDLINNKIVFDFKCCRCPQTGTIDVNLSARKNKKRINFKKLKEYVIDEFFYGHLCIVPYVRIIQGSDIIL